MYRRPGASAMKFTTALIYCCILGVAGCQSTPDTRRPVIEAEAGELESLLSEAESTSRIGIATDRYLDAAHAFFADAQYERAAFAVTRLRQRLIEQYRAVQTGDFDKSDEDDASTALSPTQRYELTALEIRLMIAGALGGDPTVLWRTLQPTSDAQATDFRYVQAQVKSADNDHIGAASALMTVPPRRTDDPQRLADAIWQSLSSAPSFRLAELRARAANTYEEAWWELADVYTRALSPSLQEQAWLSWRRRNSGHLASQFPPIELTTRITRPETIALLLPLSGQLAGAGGAIRDGFVAAYLSERQSGRSRFDDIAEDQRVLIYDTGAGSIAALVEQALADGADALVGPLSKPNVQALIDLDMATPAVALNRIDDTAAVEPNPDEWVEGNPEDPDEGVPNEEVGESFEIEGAGDVPDAPSSHDELLVTAEFERDPEALDDPSATGDTSLEPVFPNVIQLSLAVEDEAIALALRIADDKLERLSVFTGASAWSDRAVSAFREHLSPDVVVTDERRFDEMTQITAVAGEALRVNESNERHAFVERTTGLDIEFTPRRRQDVDAIVAFVDDAEFDTLVPALRFHFASDIPVFVTSSALRDGRPSNSANGTRFTELPWRLYASKLRADVASAFPNAATSPSLYALGVDAFRIVNQLERVLTRRIIAGSTGRLTLGDDGVVVRDPAWGIVLDGQLVPLPMVVSRTELR